MAFFILPSVSLLLFICASLSSGAWFCLSAELFWLWLLIRNVFFYMMMKDSCGILYCNRAVILDTIKKSIDNANDLSDKKEDVCKIMYSRNGKDYLDSCHLSYYLLFCLLWICMMIDREAISSAEAAPFIFGIAFWLTFAANIIWIYNTLSYYEWPILVYGFCSVMIPTGPIWMIYYVFSAFGLAIHPETVCKILFFF